ncbi:MAG: hypothetical protein MOGMAGMI_02535 [Candidatus Omnitrophica bacterium]|nr:hypothetical protein [Candidatus Omnitrophota bacterium]
MPEKPIIFRGEMVRAILDGRKTQTRRVVKPQPSIEDDGLEHLHKEGEVCLSKFTGYPLVIKRHGKLGKITMPLDCPYGVTGDHLWVREAFVIESNFNLDSEENYPPPFKDGRPIRRVDDADYGSYWQQFHYRATDPKPELIDTNTDKECGWRPAIYMPRWASRITLEIVNVCVERLQKISDYDAEREGIAEWEGMFKEYDRPDSNPGLTRDARYSFQTLWDSINAARGYSWDSNPFVWVIEFRKV